MNKDFLTLVAKGVVFATASYFLWVMCFQPVIPETRAILVIFITAMYGSIGIKTMQSRAEVDHADLAQKMVKELASEQKKAHDEAVDKIISKDKQ